MSFDVKKMVDNLDYTVAPQYPDGDEYKIENLVDKFSGLIIKLLQAPGKEKYKCALEGLAEIGRISEVLLPIKQHIEKMRAGDKSKISKEVFEDLIRLDLKMREVTGAVYVTVATLRKFAAEAKRLRDQGSSDQ